ncbi:MULTISPECIES: YfiM family lipoprotein [Erwinia]|uniref:Lipoprotein n=1 Tax=Erwinia rhapontici TaxID=55212 RepID=A0ABM7N405_ERWRD|nr:MULTISPECIES: YfiM family lipoprotein [Erwinia]MCS3609070.1 putative lipoprotein [Erwinia rhapontici]NKG29290.1 YfiM family lipoprotein [Erwinia rhapontici]NNS10219.1 YfiM family lipoprotein [Erwinia sp. JH02]TDS97163.1 putative lipoprotein [Erwinia rhapontici]UDQ79281.1 YfiM family lipoprotein [Erwinia rhapontici]
MRICLLSAVLFCSGCTHMAQDEWTGRDKAQHFLSSAFLSAAGSAYGEHQNWREGHSGSFGVMFAISLGAVKELYDSREGGSGWSWKDFSWDVAGAATGYALWNLGQ